MASGKKVAAVGGFTDRLSPKTLFVKAVELAHATRDSAITAQTYFCARDSEVGRGISGSAPGRSGELTPVLARVPQSRSLRHS